MFPKKILKGVLTFALLAAVLITALLLSVKFIPNEKIRDNLEKSALYFKDKDAYQFLDSRESMNKVQDNRSDAILLQVVYYEKSDDVFRSTMKNEYYEDFEYGGGYAVYQASLGMSPNTEYSRYWHGLALFVRPLLTVTDLTGIRKTVFVLLCILLLVSIIMLCVRKRWDAAILLLISLSCVGFWCSSMSLEYEYIYLALLTILPFYIWLEKRGDDALMCLAVAGGVLTAFLDFLTFETVVYLVPMILVLLIREKEGRLENAKKTLWMVVTDGVIFVVSFGAMYLLKWTLASAAYGYSVFGKALSSAAYRFGETADFEQLSKVKQFFYAPLANLSALYGGVGRVDAGHIAGGLFLTILVVSSVYYLLRGKQKSAASPALWLMAAVPFVRYLVLNNHSYLHNFYTYKALQVTILAVLTLVWLHIDVNMFTQKSISKKSKKRRTK